MDTAVSVIVPVYNREELIGRCIESILNQTLKNIEVIAVNDGSSDRTAYVLDSIMDERLKVISQPNAGQGFARNTGIAAANGKYIAFVDSDDTIEKEMLEAMYKEAEKEQADIVQCGICDIYPDGQRVIQLKNDNETVNITDKGKYMDKYFLTLHSNEVCNKLIRRNFLEDTGVKFRDTKKYFSEDLLFNLEIINYIKRISFMSAPYYNYYKNVNSHLHQNAENRLVSLCALFRTYISEADEIMKSAASYAAAMIIIYNVGFCAEDYRETAKAVLAGKELSRYISEALKRKCTFKHRLLLTAMYFSPIDIKLLLSKKYSERWQI